MASYIHYNTTTNLVTRVSTTSQSVDVGDVEVFENHPTFFPVPTRTRWQRTAPETYVDLGPVSETPTSHTLAISGADTTPSGLKDKIVEGTAIDFTLINPGGNEQIRIDVDINELTEDTTPDTANDFLLSYDTSASAHKKVRINNFAGADEHICVCDCTGTMALTSSFQDIAWDHEHIKTSGFTHSTSSAIITSNISALLLITAYVTTETTGVAGDNTTEIQLLEDTGSGYTLVEGTSLRISNDQVNADDANTSSFSMLRTVASGTSFKLQVRRLTGTGTISTVQGGSGLTFTTIGRGAQGPIGPTGSGSNITLKSNGTNVANTPHSIINFNTGLMVTDNGGGQATVSCLFGANFHKTENTISASITGTTAFQQYLRLTTSSVPAGTYRVGWFYVWGINADNRDFGARVQVDDTINLINPSDATYKYHREEIQDSDAAQRHTNSGFNYVTFGSAGAHTIDLDYGTIEYDSKTAYMYHAVIEFWRVS